MTILIYGYIKRADIRLYFVVVKVALTTLSIQRTSFYKHNINKLNTNI